jgi:large subunit ribosomal protein L29
MKIKDIKAMKKTELTKTLADLKDKLAKAKFNTAGSKSKNVKEQANMRRDIARILTILKEAK